MTNKNKHIGSDFDDFLDEDGILEEVEAVAHKRVLAYQVEQAMERQHMSKTALAARMKTSLSSVDRLLDPTNPDVTLVTLQQAAAAIGKRLQIAFVDAPAPLRKKDKRASINKRPVDRVFEKI